MFDENIQRIEFGEQVEFQKNLFLFFAYFSQVSVVMTVTTYFGMIC